MTERWDSLRSFFCRRLGPIGSLSFRGRSCLVEISKFVFEYAMVSMAEDLKAIDDLCCFNFRDQSKACEQSF